MCVIRQFLLSVLCLAAAAFAPQTAVADPSIEHLLAQGQHAQALSAADSLLVTAPNAPDLHLMRAYALLGLGQLDAATQAGARAEQTEAAFLYAMLHGHISAQSGQHNIANFWYRRAHDAATQPAQTQTAIAYARGAQAARNWVWGAEFNLRQSDNLNFATSENTVDLGGLAFVLADENTAQAGTTLAAAFSVKYKAVNTADHLLQVGISTGATLQNETGITSRSLGFVIDGQRRIDGATPLMLRYGGSVTRQFPVAGDVTTTQAAYIQLGGTATPTLRWSARLNGARSDTAGAEQTDLDLTLGFSGTMANGIGYGVSYTQARVNSDNANLASSEQRLRVSVTPKIDALPLSLSLFAEAGQRRFDRETPFFGGMRVDDSTSFGLTIAPKEFTVMGMTPSVTFRQSRRNSNIDINDAVSQDFFVGLQSSF